MARVIRSIGTPWFTIWKNPNSVQARVMVSNASCFFLSFAEDSMEEKKGKRSMVGMLDLDIVYLVAQNLYSTLEEILSFFLLTKKKKKCGFVNVLPAEVVHYY